MQSSRCVASMEDNGVLWWWERWLNRGGKREDEDNLFLI